MNPDNDGMLDGGLQPESAVDPSAVPDNSTMNIVEAPIARRRFSFLRVLVWGVLIVAIVAGVMWVRSELAGYDQATKEYADRISQPQGRASYALPGDEEFWDRLNEILPEGDAAFTEAQAAAWADEMIPMVEAITGRTFFERPIIRLADRPTLSAALNRDAAMQSNLLFTHRPQQVQEMLGGQVMAAALLGKYGVADRVLFIAPRNFEPILDMAGTDATLTEPLAKLVLAHELAHALQDQHVMLGTRIQRAGSDPDRTFCLSAVIEGHAIIVQDEVGARLGLDDAVQELSWLLTSGELTAFDHPVADLVSNMVRAQYQQSYIGGRDFMRHHLEAGGHERLWSILESPPERSGIIEQPALYGSSEPTIDFRSALSGIDSHYADERRRWVTQLVTLGSIMLRSFFESLDPELAAEVMPKLREAHTMTLSDTADRNALSTVTLFILHDENVGPALVRRLHEAGVTNLDRMKGVEGVNIDEVQTREVDAEGVGSGVVLEYRYAGFGTTPTKYRIHRFARGTTMLEVMDAGVGLPDDKVRAIVLEVIARCDELVNPEAAAD